LVVNANPSPGERPPTMAKNTLVLLTIYQFSAERC
jgi:hypothetical protein